MTVQGSYGASALAQAQQITAMGMANVPQQQPATELDVAIAEVRSVLFGTLKTAQQIALRVLPPPPPQAGGSGAIGPVENTYTDKMRSLHRLAEEAREILEQLASRV